ncbi:MAG TPA: TIGR03435 family protein [Vicinamibacterales bacterium]|nr:TIGR03435 family protein [Vicinamibacterales bacterium]
MRRLALVCLGVAVVGVLVHAQGPRFDVASIKRNVSGNEGSRGRIQPGGRVSFTNEPLRRMILDAYRLQDFQVAGGPDWVGTDRWDIVAKAEGDPPIAQVLEMMRTLLADRFKLAIHHEMRDAPIYALVIAKPDHQRGAQLHRSSTDCAALAAAARARGQTQPPTVNGRVSCGMNTNNGSLEANAVTMDVFARRISTITGRTVVDKTGLAGNFDLMVHWTPDAPPGADRSTAANGDGPTFVTAIQEQLGLKLEPQRGVVDFLIIDSVEHPIED